MKLIAGKNEILKLINKNEETTTNRDILLNIIEKIYIELYESSQTTADKPKEMERNTGVISRCLEAKLDFYQPVE